MNDPGVQPKHPFRILALDGGGIRGLFSASLLAELERLSKGRLADQFDLIVGTSTGGIIALALAFGIPAQRVLELYRDRGPEIFGKPDLLRGVFRPKYANSGLQDALRDVFEDRVLNDVLTPICVTSFELTNSHPRIWKDDHAPDLCLGDVLARRVALAGAAAPTYFPAAQVTGNDSHVDGGLFANNPALVGVTEALRYFDCQIGDIRLLSVGAGEHARRIPFSVARRMGALRWGTGQLFDQMLIAQSRVAHEIVRSMLGGNQYARLNIPLEQPYPLDDYRSAGNLEEPGAQTARVNYARVHDLFLFGEATVGRAHRTAVRDARHPAEPKA